MNAEFYIYDDELWYITTDSQNKKLTEHDVDLISQILSLISDMYPDAYSELKKEYSRSAMNVPYYQYALSL